MQLFIERLIIDGRRLTREGVSNSTIEAPRASRNCLIFKSLKLKTLREPNGCALHRWMGNCIHSFVYIIALMTDITTCKSHCKMSLLNIGKHLTGQIKVYSKRAQSKTKVKHEIKVQIQINKILVKFNKTLS